MPWPSAQLITLSERQRQVLERLGRASTSPQAVALRARVVCAAADGTSTRQIAQRLGLTRHTVQLWRDRWAAAAEALLAAEAEGAPDDERALVAMTQGLLADAPRPGAPPTFTPAQLGQVMAIACEPPGESGRPISQWTPRELADEAVTRGHTGPRGTHFRPHGRAVLGSWRRPPSSRTTAGTGSRPAWTIPRRSRPRCRRSVTCTPRRPRSTPKACRSSAPTS